MKKKRQMFELKDMLEAINQRFNLVEMQFNQNQKQLTLLSSKLNYIQDDVEEIKITQEQHYDIS